MIALLVAAVIFFAVLWGLSSSVPPREHEPGPEDVENAYVTGDADDVAAGLDLVTAERRIPLLVALGRYQAAVDLAAQVGVDVDTPPVSAFDVYGWLNRINWPKRSSSSVTSEPLTRASSRSSTTRGSSSQPATARLLGC